MFSQLVRKATAGVQSQDGALIEQGKWLELRYTYTIDDTRCADILPNVEYYLRISPHLQLPSSLEQVLKISGEEVQFGTLYADGNRAWVTFLPYIAPDSNPDSVPAPVPDPDPDAAADPDRNPDLDPNNTARTVISHYGGLYNADLSLNCFRSADVPDTERPIEGHDNLYAIKFENTDQELLFGYAENEPVTAKAQLSKSGSLTDKNITWTVDYTPWQNPAENDGVTLDTAFELRDTIDANLNSYATGSAKIDNVNLLEYTSGDAIPQDAEAYVLVETPADGGDTTLIFGGKAFNAGTATGKDPARPLKITYETAIKDELLLPVQGGAGAQNVSNTVQLFAKTGADTGFQSTNISSSKTVPISRPTWLTKTGETTRDPGNGSTTEWTVNFSPNGFVFSDENSLTLHDQLSAGSELVENSVKVNGIDVTATTGKDNSFTISGLKADETTKSIIITYQTKVEEDLYESGTDLGDNVAWFAFQYGDPDKKDYETPKVKTHVPSSAGSDSSGTATLVKTNGGYNAATRTIAWEVTINPHKADLKSGTFIDDLSGVGPAACGKGGHEHGLEVVGGKNGVTILVDGAPLDDDSVTVTYANQKITVETIGVGQKVVTLQYTTQVCDPCVFANNTTATFKNVISTTDMSIGKQTNLSRSAESTVTVNPTVLTKRPPVYHYATGRMKWTVEVNAAGLPMTGVELTDVLPKGLSYVEGSLTQTTGATAEVTKTGDIETLTIKLDTVPKNTTVTFETAVDPEALGFAKAQSVEVKNTIDMAGTADGIEFEKVSSTVEKTFTNHGLVKSSTVNNPEEFIEYAVLINPYRLALPGNPSLVDTLDKRLQLDADTMKFYKVTLTGTTTGADQKPSYQKMEPGETLNIAAFDLDANSFTVELPITAGSQDAYLLTYRADIIRREAGGYSNSVRFVGEGVELGGSKNNSADVSGGGGVAARKATISIVKTDSETKIPIPGVSFTLYQWDSANETRGMAFAKGVTDAQGKLSFRVKPGAHYQLVETQSASGYGTAFGWSSLPPVWRNGRAAC